MPNQLTPGDYVMHPQFKGFVLRYVGPQMSKQLISPPDHDCEEEAELNESDDCWCGWYGEDEDDWEELPTGSALVRMVGDDQIHPVEYENLTPYTGPVCSCGQAGCGWHGVD